LVLYFTMDLLDTYAPANCSEKGETEMEIIKKL